MQIENQIAEALQTKAMEITSPTELDARIIRLYEKQAQREREKSMGLKKKRMIVFALVGLIALMITGFTVKYMIKLGDERISLEYYASENMNYDPAIGSVVREQLQQVKEQLQIGESAYVYSNEIARLTPNLGDLFYAEYVANPYIFADYEVWKAKLNEKIPDYKLPMTVQGSLSFVGGEEEYPFGGLINQLEIAKHLQDEIKLSGKDLSWKKVEPDREEFPVFTTLYKDENHGMVQVTLEPIIGQSKVKIVGVSEAAHEKVTINGHDADYAEFNKFLYSESNHYQSLVWVETLEEMSIKYSVGSSSELMTKERLIAIGESMK